MKKSLAVLLLLLLVVGCGKSDQTSELSPQKPPAPTLADSFQGKRIHFQFEKPESNHTLEFWLQVAEAEQLTAGSGQLTMGEGDEGLTTAFVRKSNTIFLSLLPSVLELRFAKAELSAGGLVTCIEHTGQRTDNFQARVASAADSTAFATVKGSIVKIEAAQEIEAITFEAWSQESNTDPSESIQSSKSAAAKTQLQAISKALELYQIDMDSYPDQKVGLNALTAPREGSENWGGPYLVSAVPPDPWGKEYFYELELNELGHQAYKIWSAGDNQKNENGKDGTDDIVVYSESGRDKDATNQSASPAKPLSRVARYVMGLMKKYDTDKNGSLSKKEWSQNKYIKDSFDTNADGKLTPEELTKGFEGQLKK